MPVRLLGHTPLFAALLGLGLAPAGCTGGDAGARGEGLLPLWTAEPDLRVGSVDDSATALTFFTDVEVAHDGAMYLLHPREQVVRVVRGDGSPGGALGGRGDGPGEFQNAIAMGWVADTLWVLDANGYRFSLFADGEFRTSFSVPFDLGEGMDAVNPPRANGLLFDGTVVGSPPAFSHQIADGTLTHDTPMLMTRDGRVTDTVARIPFGASQWEIGDLDDPRGAAMYALQPFGDGPLWSWATGESALLVLDRPAPAQGEEAAATLTKLSLTGDTLFRRTFRRPALPITDAEVDSLIDATAEQMSGVRFWRETAIGTLRAWAERGLHRPPARPAFREIVAGRDGTIWLQESTGAQETVAPWLVLDPQGEPLARVRLPETLRVMEADRAHVWGGERDALDVPYLVRLRIAPAG